MFVNSSGPNLEKRPKFKNEKNIQKQYKTTISKEIEFWIDEQWFGFGFGFGCIQLSWTSNIFSINMSVLNWPILNHYQRKRKNHQFLRQHSVTNGFSIDANCKCSWHAISYSIKNSRKKMQMRVKTFFNIFHWIHQMLTVWIKNETEKYVCDFWIVCYPAFSTKLQFRWISNEF